MNLLRQVVFVVAALLMGGGYLASQSAYFAGPDKAAEYAQRVASPAVQVVALALLVVCVVSAFVPQGEEGAD